MYLIDLLKYVICKTDSKIKNINFKRNIVCFVSAKNRNLGIRGTAIITQNSMSQL